MTDKERATYKITNPAYNLFYVFKKRVGSNMWEQIEYYPEYASSKTGNFFTLHDAKLWVERDKENEKMREEINKKMDAWIPMDDIFL